MKNGRIYIAGVGILLAAVLTGCGDGTEDAVSENLISEVEAVTITNEPVNAEPEAAPAGIQLLYSGGLTTEDENDIQEAMETLYANLEVPEYVGEGIHMVSSPEWAETMSRKLYEGCRSYILQDGDTVLLSVYAGFDIEGNFYANICYQNEEGGLLLLKQEKSTTWLMQTSVSEGEYEGYFETWKIDSETGHIVKEEGTYANGIVVGEYTKSEYTGAPGEAFDLWTNREGFSYEKTTVTYDEQGEIAPTPTPTPTAAPTPKPTCGDTEACSNTETCGNAGSDSRTHPGACSRSGTGSRARARTRAGAQTGPSAGAQTRPSAYPGP